MVEISIQNLTKHYATLVALDNISLKIDSGEVFGLLGPNGAGKSTLLKILVGILRPTRATIRLGEYDNVADPETRVSVKDRIGVQAKRGVTTSLSTHDLDVAQTHAGRIAIIDHGKIVAVGDIESLRHLANTASDARLEDVFLRLTEEKGEDPARR